MHEAYEAAPILEKLPLTIESIACYDDILLVGTKQGHLLQYKVKKVKGSGESKFEVNLERSNKAFAKKPITQLEAVPELFILISLSDNVICVHDLMSFDLVTTVNKTKGATLFSVDLEKPTNLEGKIQYNLRICVTSKRRAQFYYWKNRDFYDLLNELSLYDMPRAMAWCKDSICIGFKRDYFLINSKNGDLKELFPLGSRQLEPLVTKLADNRLALGRDIMSILINAEGEPTQKHPVKWSDIPVALQHDPPYLIAILPKYVEIRTIEPQRIIQSIDLSKARFVCHGSGCVYVASANFVWRLASVPIPQQIRDLLQGKEFELALRLAEMTEEPELEKQKRIRNIQNLYAFDLFCQHRFEESMNLFATLGTDPSNVIGLYPNLLPQEYRNQLEYPDKLPDLEGGDLEKGLLALIDFLMQKRNEMIVDLNKDISTTAIVEGNSVIKTKKQLSQIIDTTLLKCYLQTNDALVAPLLRLQDNNCHIEESERILKRKEKFSELIILYQKKGLHQKALNLLMKQAARPDSQLKGHDRTVSYLQHLGVDHWDLIKEYSEWVLKKHPEDGLKIFTEDLPEVESLPCDKVLDYLENISTDLATQYLEHVILHLNNETPDFHNRLILMYKSHVSQLMKDYINSLPEGHPPNDPGHEPGELGDYRRKLIGFLYKSQCYIPERLLTRFPLDGFYEERAILLGRLGRHEQALGIYIHVLHDTVKAEQYCASHFDGDSESNKDVYVHLLRTLLKPPDPTTLGMAAGQSVPAKPNMPASLKILENHAWKIDTTKALELLPATTRVRDILTYLENVMEHQASRRRQNQVLKSMLYAENLQIQEQRIFHQSIKVNITDEKMCRVCKKRIGDSAFARYPNGVIVHYYCCKDNKVCPVDV
ncbi:hypothetical protein SNE40_010920 [Patella caerulea]|uniref:CNH domain-containing protein n=1 Tax=Patella caerulea TaxID=87958 RepID=A0AAN8JZ98_PATCE